MLNPKFLLIFLFLTALSSKELYRNLQEGTISELSIEKEISVSISSEQKLYYYLDITSMKEEVNQGSILFTGLDQTSDIQINYLIVNVKSKDEKELLKLIQQEIKDSVFLTRDTINNFFEMFYYNYLPKRVDDTYNILIIEINGANSHSYFKMKALNFPKFFLIRNDRKTEKTLEFDPNVISYYQFKLEEERYRKKTVFIYTQNKCHLLFQGNLQTQIAIDTEVLKQQSKTYLSVLKFDYQIDPEILFTIKLYCNEKYHARVLIESTSETVALFKGVRSNKIFQTVFSYEQFFNFYYVGTFEKEEKDYELFVNQKVGLFEIRTLTRVTDHILPNEYDKKLTSSFLKLNTKFEVIHISPIYPGKADFIIFKNEENVNVIKNGITHFKVSPNENKSFTLPNSNDSPIYLTLKRIGEGAVKFTLNNKMETINNDVIYKELTGNQNSFVFTSDKEVLMEIITVYDQNLYNVVSVDGVYDVNRNGVLIQFEKGTQYYSTEIEIGLTEEDKDKSLEYIIFTNPAKNENYFPLVSKCGNPVSMQLTPSNPSQLIRLDMNPYDELKIDASYPYYYAIEFVNNKDIKKLNVSINYIEKTKNDVIKEGSITLFGRTKNYDLEDANANKYLLVMTSKCVRKIDNYLYIKYQYNEIWKGKLEHKYNVFQLPAIYNGISFDLEDRNNRIFVSYKYLENEYKNLAEYQSELESFNIFYNEYVTLSKTSSPTKLEIRQPFTQSKISKNKIYLLKADVYSKTYDDLCYLYSVEKEDTQSPDNFKVIEFKELTYTFDKDSQYNGNWYLVIVSSFTEPVANQLIIFAKEVKINNGVVTPNDSHDFEELKIGIKKKLNKRKKYYYLNITDSKAREGSIYFKGNLPTEELSINTVYINTDKPDNEEFYKKLQSEYVVGNELVYDPVNDNYELFYLKFIDDQPGKNLYLLIEIISLSDIDFDITPIDFPLVHEINEHELSSFRNLSCDKDIFCYHLIKIKPSTDEFGTKNVLLYMPNKERLVYSGSIDPIIGGDSRDVARMSKDYELLVLSFNSNEDNEISLTIKLYQKVKYDIILETTSYKVVVFDDYIRDEKIFQSVFTYNSYFPFYYVGTYENKSNFEFYNEQNIDKYQIRIIDKIKDHILPNNFDELVKPNSFYEFKNSNYEIIYINPLSPGNLNLRFFPKENPGVEKNSLNHVHLKKGEKKEITIPDDDNSIINLHVKSIENGKFELIINDDSTAVNKEIFTTIRTNKFELKAEKEMLLTFVVTYADYYQIVKKDEVVRNQNYILIEFNNTLDYGSYYVTFKSKKELNYMMQMLYTQDEKYFPLVELSRNPINGRISEANDFEDIALFERNPYDEFKINPTKYKFYYGISIQDEYDELNITFKYNKKDKQNKYHIPQNEFTYLSKKHKVLIADTDKEKIYIEMSVLICSNENNYLLMNYENNDVFRRKLDSKYNFYKYPVLYNGMDFSLENQTDSYALFYYKYSDNDNDINMQFITDVTSFDSVGKKYISIDKKTLKLNEQPLPNFKVNKMKLYLLKRDNQEYSNNYDNICYLQKLESEKRDDVIIEDFTKEKTLESKHDGKWYIIVTGEYTEVIGTKLLLYSDKGEIKNGEIVIEQVKFIELKPKGEKLTLTDKVGYYYMDISQMGKGNYGKEGSIVFSGVTQSMIYYNYESEKDTNKFIEKIKSDDRMYATLKKDTKNDLSEFFYENYISSSDTVYLILQIENFEPNLGKIEIQATEFVKTLELSENDLDKIGNLKCDTKLLPCYYSLKINPNKYESKYLVFKTNSLDRLIYKNTINPYIYQKYDQITDNNICNLVVLSYKKENEPDIVVIFKLYSSNTIDLEVKGEASDFKIVKFYGKKREEKVFQSIFSYNNYFSFYYLECYTDNSFDYELFNEQNVDTYELYYNNDLNKKILATTSDTKILPNSFANLDKKANVIFVKPKTAGNLVLRIFQKTTVPSFEKDALHNVHLYKDQEQQFTLPSLDSSESIYLSITKVGKCQLEYKVGEDSYKTIDENLSEEIKNNKITLKADSETLVLITLRYTKDLYYLVKEDSSEPVLKINGYRNILIQYRKDIHYGSSIIKLKTNKELNYKIAVGHALDEHYFPKVSLSRNPIQLKFDNLNENEDYIGLNRNPYDEMKLSINYFYYYALEFDTDDFILDVEFDYQSKDRTYKQILEENKLGVISETSKYYISNKERKKYISLMAYACKSGSMNKISMNYESDSLWSGNLLKKYNTFTLPILYTGIYFDESIQSENLLFSYKLQNDDNEINSNYIDSLEKFKKGIVSFKTDSVEISHSLSYKHHMYKIYLLKSSNKAHSANYNNICYLNKLENESPDPSFYIFEERSNLHKFKSDLNGNYYISIVAEFNEIIATRLLLHSSKINLENGAVKKEEITFKELSMGNQGLELTESMGYYYISTKTMKPTSNNEGSIVLSGLNIEDVNKFTIKYILTNETNKLEDELLSNFARIGNIVYDPKFDLYEIYYQLQNYYNYLVFSVSKNVDYPINIKASDPVRFKDTDPDGIKTITTLSHSKIDVPFYMKVKMETYFPKSIYIVFMFEKKDALIYQGDSINPENNGLTYNEITDKNDCKFTVLSYKFDKPQNSTIYFIVKLYNKFNTISFEAKIESVFEKVVLFNGNIREEKVFESIFGYNNYFPFYYLDCYNDQKEIFEMYNQQSENSYKISYNEKINENIFSTGTNYKDISSNSFFEIKERYNIFYIKPLGPGNLALRFYPKIIHKDIKKNSVNHFHIKKGETVSLQLEPSLKTIYLSITKLGKGVLTFKYGSKSEDIKDVVYTKPFKEQDTKIIFTSTDDVLIVLIANYDDFYYLIKDTTNMRRPSDLIIIQFKNETDYGRVKLSIKGKRETTYKFHMGYAKDSKYFPLVNNSKNAIISQIDELNENTDTLELEKNPYDELKMSRQFNYYYALQFNSPVLLEVNIDYVLKNKLGKANLNESDIGVINKKSNFYINNSKNQKYIYLMSYVCGESKNDNLTMNYEDDIIWSGDLKTKYNYFELPLIYNGIHFGIQSNNVSSLFSYKLSNEKNTDGRFKSEITNYKGDNLKYLKFTNNEIKFDSTPLKGFKILKTNVYLIKKNDTNANKIGDLCYLKMRESSKANDKSFFSLSQNGEGFKFDEKNKDINGDWLFSVVSEYSEVVETQILVYKGEITIKDGSIKIKGEKISGGNKKLIIIVLIVLVVIALVLIVFFIFRKKDDILNDIPSQAISLINDDKENQGGGYSKI